jgi:hypothetical protein
MSRYLFAFFLVFMLAGISPNLAAAQSGAVAIAFGRSGSGTLDILEAGSNRLWSRDGTDWWSVYTLPGQIGVGAALVQRTNDCDYGFLGNGTTTFFKAGSAFCNGVTVLAPAPFVPGPGAALATTIGVTGFPSDVWALAGGGSREFWRYNVAENSWTRLPDIPAPVQDGGAIAISRYEDMSFQMSAITGAGTSVVWVFNSASDSWTAQPTPFVMGNGAAMTWTYFGDLEILAGGGTGAFWQQSFNGVWSRLADIPGPVTTGAGITFSGFGWGEDTYALLGGGSSDVWGYHHPTNTWSRLTSMPAGNQPPVANAGNDRTVTGCPGCLVPTLLDASGTVDPEGDRMRFEWREGTRVLVFPFNQSPRSTVNLSGLGPHTLTLIVRDSRGGVSTDQVVITLQDPTVGLNQRVLELEQSLRAAETALAAAELRATLAEASLQTCSAHAAQLTTALTAAVATVQANLAAAFGDPLWVLPGVTTTDQLANLVQAIGNMNKGSKQQLYQSLNGK